MVFIQGSQHQAHASYKFYNKTTKQQYNKATIVALSTQRVNKVGSYCVITGFSPYMG